MFKMQKFQNLDLRAYGKGTYAGDFDDLNEELSDFVMYMPSECNWEKMPNMLRAIIEQQRRFKVVGNVHFDFMISSLIVNNSWFQKVAPQCGSPKQFIRGLEQ